MRQEIWSDIKHAVRLLRRSPRNTLIAVAILGIGIGANTVSVVLQSDGFGGTLAVPPRPGRSFERVYVMARSRGDALALVTAIVGVSLAIGLPAAVALNRALAAFLTEVGTMDAVVLAASRVAIVVSAGGACLVPVLAAARLDPVRALKAE